MDLLAYGLIPGPGRLLIAPPTQKGVNYVHFNNAAHQTKLLKLISQRIHINDTLFLGNIITILIQLTDIPDYLILEDI